MYLYNFELVAPQPSIALRGLGYRWDLHAFAEFTGFHFAPGGRLRMEWKVPPDKENPWGSPGNGHPGLRLLFSNVTALVVSAPSVDAEPDDDVVVADVTLLDADEEPTRLRSEFESGRILEITSRHVELQPILRMAG